MTVRYFLLICLIIFLLGGVIGWMLHKPNCPEITSSRFEKVDTVRIASEVSPDKIKLTGIDKPKNDRTKFVKTENVQKAEEKKSFIEQINFCDSLHEAFYSTYHYELSDTDSIAKISVKMKVSENKPISFIFDRTYTVRTFYDTIPKKVPIERNCFTGGLFSGGNKTLSLIGVSLGYHFGKNDLSLMYDVNNSFKLISYKRELGK